MAETTANAHAKDGASEPSRRDFLYIATASAGALVVIENARVFDTTEAAVADLEKVYATTARRRDMSQRIVTARKAAEEIRAHEAVERRIGVLFGPERTGLVNDDLALADTLITIPLNPGFTSLNLAQCVLLVGYEWWTAGDATPDDYLHTGASRPATKGEMLNMFEHLEAELEDGGDGRGIGAATLHQRTEDGGQDMGHLTQKLACQFRRLGGGEFQHHAQVVRQLIRRHHQASLFVGLY